MTKMKIFEHPLYLYYQNTYEPRLEVCYINFSDIVYDSINSEKYISNELEKLGISSMVYKDTYNLSVDNEGVYDLNIHIDLLASYLKSRIVLFETSIDEILKIFQKVFRESPDFLHSDVCHFIQRYSKYVDIVLYTHSRNSFEIDKLISSQLFEYTLGNVFFNNRKITNLVDFVVGMKNDIGYQKSTIIDQNKKLEELVAKKYPEINYISAKLNYQKDFTPVVDQLISFDALII
jgi:hypothetical protein